MNQTITELLSGKGNNYILPFFWQHGESEEVLREYMGAIDSCGIKAVCVEARPHPDFAGDGWWHDMDIILEEARKREMKIWILDDAHFPTGQAAGRMKDADIHLRKQYIMVERTEVCGPIPQVTLDVSPMAMTRKSMLNSGEHPFFGEKDKKWFEDDKLLAVVASCLTESEAVKDTLFDLTDQVIDGILEWDVPCGMWRIFVLFNTRNGGGRSDYINMLDEESCRVQLDGVYEPHYAHYKNDFGKTIAGFFSDEPCLGNTTGFEFDESIGRRMMPLPWNKDMPAMLEMRLGEDYLPKLIALWTKVGTEEFTGKVRYAYMDAMTSLVAKNFSRQLGEWCEQRGVEYIGHVVEDSNQHSRMGSSQGHYFRSMIGQHMSGIDDIGNQVMPGGDHSKRLSSFGKGAEGEFYHFELGKLGSSFAHIDPKKQGRAMCEIFGAYGWNAGVRLMKYLTDHFLVRGINYFVPHAFSPKEFPDPDCPPHFYAHGENPQYRHFGKLMAYMNRMCHVLNGGVHVAPVALLYHGEAEWTGDYMFDQKPGRELLEHQIDFDILPSDVFTDTKEYRTSFDGRLQINQETYQVLILPYAEFITKNVAQFIVLTSGKGFPVIFIDAFPEAICDVWEDKESAKLIEEIRSCGAVVAPLAGLSDYLIKHRLVEIKLSAPFEKLRYYHYEKQDAIYYMFSNEDMGNTFEGIITVATKGKVTLYDAMTNQLWKADYTTVEEGTEISLKLSPYSSIVAVFDDNCNSIVEKPEPIGSKTVLEGTWKVAIAESKEYPKFKDISKMDKLVNFGRTLPDFSGFICYEQEFDYMAEVTGNELLSIADAYEGVEIFLNGVNIGMQICPPYLFLTGNALIKGKNSLRIEVATTLYRKMLKISGPSFFGPKSIPIEPTGIVGEVSIYKKI